MDTTVTTLIGDVETLCDSGRYEDALEVATGPLALLVEGIRLSNSQPEKAKDLISEVSRSLDGENKLRADIALAYCYSYTGETKEGLIIIKQVLSVACGPMRDRALLAKGTLQIDQPRRAKKTLENLSFDSPALQGKLHNQLARTYRQLRDDDKAIIEYSGAAHYFELDDNPILSAIALNNMAGVLREEKQYEEANEAVDRAIRMFTDHHSCYLPQALDQKAQILVAEQKYHEALNLIERALGALSEDRKEAISECLTTKAQAVAGLNRTKESFDLLHDAKSLAKYLERDDLVLAVAKGRKKVAEIICLNADKSLVELALQQSERSYRSAGLKLGLSHAGIMKAARRYRLKPAKPRLRNIVK